MSEETEIEWANHTGGPWLLCTEVSPGCLLCYARTLIETRLGWMIRKAYKAAGFDDWETRPLWGKSAPRVKTKGFWTDVWRLNAKAKAARVRKRMFPSMIDWLDDMPAGVIDQDGNQLDKDKLLAEFLYCVKETPWLDWLLLTKRPEKFRERLQSAADAIGESGDQDHRFWIIDWLNGHAPPNVWIGVSAEDQQRADLRCNVLVTIPATIRFVSAEPLLGPINFAKWLSPDKVGCGGRDPAFENCIDWVIVGGESGTGSRQCDVDWIRAIVAQCRETRVKVFVKQLGARPVVASTAKGPAAKLVPIVLNDSKGGNMDEWSEDLRVREIPPEHTAKLAHMKRVQEFTAEGFAGVDGKTGMIVDRRRHPDAIPVQANSLLGVPKPKKLPNSNRSCDK